VGGAKTGEGAQHFNLARGAPTPRYGPDYFFETIFTLSATISIILQTILL
jgi:hypothetical protein